MASEGSKRWVERLAWIFIYGGLLALVLSLFLPAQEGLLGGLLQIGGLVIAAMGAGLIWVRAQMK